MSGGLWDGTKENDLVVPAQINDTIDEKYTFREYTYIIFLFLQFCKMNNVKGIQ